ncbi:hypothetical protein APB26_31940 [Pseudomonas aeruginosa]|uniref:hypothetical protein n=1 Tax=Pseudomonas aeruginosa TaxID=287 RepID=UPI00071B9CAB|nr:hypothetical protein [Pseudomonas aeruginosa]KSQ21600.1 hypothetical protein APB26_31940 [Pseudomonas aeruginosa]RPV61269.1 hypothetical protein IPC838_18270 [Pseudomonas aeruginosa]
MVDNSIAIEVAIADLLACGDDRQKWIEVMASIIEHAAELDDLALVRLGKDATRYEQNLWCYASGPPDSASPMPSASSFYRQALELASIERNLRRQVLLAYAKALRLMHGEMK